MYSLINTACTGADLKTEQNWLERQERQGRKTMFICNCLHFFLVTKLVPEVSVTFLCAPGEENFHPEKRGSWKKECQFSPSLLSPGEMRKRFYRFWDIWCNSSKDFLFAGVLELPQDQHTFFLSHKPDDLLLSPKFSCPFQLCNIRVHLFAWILVFEVKRCWEMLNLLWVCMDTCLWLCSPLLPPLLALSFAYWAKWKELASSMKGTQQANIDSYLISISCKLL